MKRHLVLGWVLLPVAANAQLFGTGLSSDTLQGAAPFGSPINDDRTYVHGWFDQLEGRLGDGSPYLRWDGQGWIGDDYNKFWVKSEGRYNAQGRNMTSDGDHEFLYDRPITTYFDVQAGVRTDIDSGTGRTWAALGIQGLAIGFWNVEATAYASQDGHYALRTNAYYDLFLTQRLVLQPQFETNWYTRSDSGRQIGAGASDIDMGLRLRYEISRKCAPYVGVADQHFFGGTADYERANGGRIDDLRFLAGIAVWF